MADPYVFTWGQENIPGLRKTTYLNFFGNKIKLWDGYELPDCQANLARRLDNDKIVTGLGAMPFRAEIYYDDVKPPKSDMPWKTTRQHASGQPIQPTHPTETVKVYETQVEYGAREVEIPAPLDGYAWVQGHPFSPLRMSTAGQQYDLHMRLIQPDGATFEMIGAVPHYNQWNKLDYITCSHIARYDIYGNIAPGDRTVVKADIQASALSLGVDEPDHRLGLVIRGDDRNPDHDQDLDLWVALDPSAVPKNLTPDARRFARMAVERGFYTFDHSSKTDLDHITDGRWQNTDFGGWSFKLSDLRIVTNYDTVGN